MKGISQLDEIRFDDKPLTAILGPNVIAIASEIHAVNNTHEFVNRVIETLNIERSAGLIKIVEAASLSPHWADYVAELRTWLTARSQSVIEPTVRTIQTVSYD